METGGNWNACFTSVLVEITRIAVTVGNVYVDTLIQKSAEPEGKVGSGVAVGRIKHSHALHGQPRFQRDSG